MEQRYCDATEHELRLFSTCTYAFALDYTVFQNESTPVGRTFKLAVFANDFVSLKDTMWKTIKMKMTM